MRIVKKKPCNKVVSKESNNDCKSCSSGTKIEEQLAQSKSIPNDSAINRSTINENGNDTESDVQPTSTSASNKTQVEVSSISDANDHSDNKTEPSSLQKFLQVLEEVFKYIWKIIKSIGKELNNHKFPIVVCGAIGGVIGFFVGAVPGIFIGIGVGAIIGYGASKCFCTTITNQKIEDSKDQLTTGEKLSAPSVQLSTSTQPQV